MSSPVSDTTPIRPGEELNITALEEYVRRHLPEEHTTKEARTLMSVEQFPGGHSNLTYLVRFGDKEFVMRRPPFGPVPPTAHDMPREFRVLSMVHPVFNLAPRPYLLCEDPSIIGVPFYLMERRQGYVVRRELPPAISQDVDLRRRISEALIDTLAALHAVDIQATGIHALGKPAGFVERQIQGWAGRWEKAKTSEVPELDAIKKWLLERVPAPQAGTLVHNDFKLDNVMLDYNAPARVVAVLDWEMCTVGDPLVDLGLLLCYWPQAGDPVSRRESISPVTTLPGWLTRKELTARYASRTGRDTSSIQFYEAFALFKVAVVIQQIYFRYERGQTHDTRFAEFGARAIGLLQTAWNVAQCAESSGKDPSTV